MSSSSDLEKYPVPDSYIKNVAIRLPADFKLINAPFPIEKEEQKGRIFAGHSENILKFISFLRSGHGVFLVTGYRGMGKTSFVNKVIREFHDNPNLKENHPGQPKDVLDIHLTLAQNNPKEIDILRLITSSTYDRFTKWRENSDEQIQEKERLVKVQKQNIIFNYVLILMIVLMSIPILLIIKPELFLQYINNPVGWQGQAITVFSKIKRISYFFLAGATCYIIFFYLIRLSILRNKIRLHEKKNFSPAYQRLKLLNERCFASLTQENNQTESFSSPGSIPGYNISNNQKKTKEQPIATVKQLEYELQQFLTEASGEHLEFMFVFDELDKIDPAAGNSYLYSNPDQTGISNGELSYQLDMRNRKQAVINVIAGLKNFLTSATAQFIFIAGREMFDASLADIADRQSSVSSIFTYIFNIESLLKTSEQGDIRGKNSSLSYSIEEYISIMLFGVESKGKPLYNLIHTAYKICTGEQHNGSQEEYETPDPGHQVKLYFTIQNFITYLTYRSNGSPKKMIRAIQEIVVIKQIRDYQKTIVYVGDNQRETNSGSFYYLYFDYYTQYKIGFLSYLFRPFLIQYGRSFKLYSDNINVSTAYLFDHLIKYHPFAFSLTNLELIPEVLSANKTPAIREHIKQIIQHLSANHLRETEISLFDYKFYSRTNNEIAFLSKISEQEAAAFNFTLDESRLVILHMRHKISELRETYASYVGSDESGQIPQIYSIAHINGILGDLHFFDQEYNDAISAYADANRPINHLQMRSMNMRDFFTLVKNKLKQGLCFEKMGAFVDALAFYNDSCEDTLNYMNYKISGTHFSSDELTSDELNHIRSVGQKDVSFINSSLNDALELIVQCFLAKVIVQEKMGLDGLTGPKIFIDLGSFLSIVERISKKSSKAYLIAGQAFLMTGKLLYYKNSATGFEGIESYKHHLPPHIKEKLARLTEKYGPKPPEPLFPRQPLLALYLYIMGLNEVMASRSAPDGRRDHHEYFFKQVIEHRNIAHGLLLQLGNNLNQTENQRYTGIHFSQMGGFLSNIGDCLLAKFKVDISAEEEEDEYFDSVKSFKIKQLFDLNGYSDDKALKDPCIFFTTKLRASDPHLSEMADVIRCYYLAGQYYLKYGRSHSCSFQYRKILWVLRLVLDEKSEDSNENAVFIQFLKTTIVIPALKLTSQNSEHTGCHIINKAIHYNLDSAFVMNNTSNHPENREIILLFNYIRIKMRENVERKMEKLISPYNPFASQYSRILELDFHAKRCYYTYETTIRSVNTSCWAEDDLKVAREYLFNMHSILKILKIYGTDFIAGHSYYAYTHYRIGDFLYKIKDGKLYKDHSPLTDYLRKYINHISEEQSYTITDYAYHFNMAAEMYNRTIQLHTAGKEYEKSLTDMIYLEDDFNDNAYHFGAAFERYMMINGVFRKRLRQCADKTNRDIRFNPDSYE